jgi:putative membrane-bound dehydrogenase-like protein
MSTCRILAFATLSIVVASGSIIGAPPDHKVYGVGLARVDITPVGPVRLNGFGFRRTSFEGITQRIAARALAIDDGNEPALLITAEVLGIPADIRAELARRFQAKVGLKPERLAVTATHTHTAPMLKGANPTIFGEPIKREEQEQIDQYTTQFLDKLEAVGLEALKNRKPSRMSYGIGTVGFAKNRRPQGGPVDHDLPMLVVRDLEGKIRAVYVSYACHCVTLSNNKISGDWAGFASRAIEEQAKDTHALISIGSGADANPSSRTQGESTELAERQGLEIAHEVERMLGGYLTPVTGKLETAQEVLELPLAAVPSKEEWEKRSQRKDGTGYHARVQLEKLSRGESLPTKVDYTVQSWMFGYSLAMVFLPGEVVADYGLRLKRELDGRRLWINAYANEAPCYIPSERVLKEGGYEGGGAMIYYDLPGPFKPGLEKPIIDAVHAQIGERFASPYDSQKTQGTIAHSPQQSTRAIQTKPGLAVDLVVAEPLVVSPVAIDFGPDGRLWVVEMIDYPAGKQGDYKPGGRVRVLESTQGDGRFDKATVFLDDIPFPTDIKVWRKGVLVCAAPDIIYAEDTKRDGKADVIRKLYSGFGNHNFQARVNSLQYSLDNWIHGSCGLFGGKIKTFASPTLYPLGDRDFRIKPDTGDIEPATGRTQQGRVRDDWENWFGCDNTNLCWHYVLDERYLRRNPHVAAPNTTIDVPDYPHSNQLYPIKKDLQLFPLSGPAGFTTAACGIGIYRDDQMGSEYHGDVFVCEPVNILIHRLKLSPKGSTFAGRRVADEQTSEFLASTDNWSRPVQAKTGPDGALWVVDMYRFVIEHPRWIPPAILANLDVRAGQNMGRIYRVCAKDKPLRAWPRFDKLDTPALVADLDTVNGWQRDTVSQMILWNADPAAIGPLQELVRKSERPETRVHALVLLDGLRGLDAEIVRRALHDTYPGVRRHAIRLAEQFVNGQPELGAMVAGMVEDADAQVRLQCACSLGYWQDPEAGKALAELALAHAEDPYVVAAVLSSVNDGNLGVVLNTALSAKSPGDNLARQLVSLAVVMNDGKQLPTALKQVTQPWGGRYEPWQLAGLAGMYDALERGLSGAERRQAKQIPGLSDILHTARKTAIDPRSKQNDLLAAIAILGREPDSRAFDIDLLAGLLSPQYSAETQAAAIAGLNRISDDRVGKVVLAGWKNHSPSLRAEILELLLSREGWLRLLLKALESKAVAAGEVDAPRRQRLLTHKDTAIREAAQKIFVDSGTTDRQKVVKNHEDVTSMAGDRTRGKAVFAKTCSICHQLEGVGHPVGPDLAQLATKSPLYLLTEILDPNRNVDSRYIEYQALLKNGRTMTGLLAAESANSITLRGQESKEQNILRSDIEQLASTGKSLMPEGLEKDLPKPALADLIAYLSGLRLTGKRFAGNHPEVVHGRDGTIALLATQCHIYGKEIDYEPELQNIGMWRGDQDHILWNVQLDRPGEYDVYFDYSCHDASAGNRFLVEGGDPVLRGTVVGTGAWNKYQQRKIGTLKVPSGASSIILRPDGPLVREALLDLRGLYLVPRGGELKLVQP